MKPSDFSRLIKDRSGNFGIMTAILLPVLLGAAGVALDVTNAMQVRSQLQGLVDAATLATASAMADKEMTAAEAESFATSYFVGQAAQETAPENETAAEKTAREKALKDGVAATATVTSGSGNSQTYSIKMAMTYDVALSGLSSVLGLDTMQVGVSSASESARAGNALSMYLALDESGSMADDTSTVNPSQSTKQVRKTRQVQKTKKEQFDCGSSTNPRTCERTVHYTDTEYYYESYPNYLTKMASLKIAAAAMFTELTTADPNNELIRVGADSYDDATKREQPIGWGTAAVATYVSNLPSIPDGGTDASGAMAKALAALEKANTTEATEQGRKKNTSFERFIVLMTDGEMTGNSSRWNSGIDDKVRGLCTKAKDDGIKIYAVAFMAPDKGKSLLNHCASGTEYYYEPSNMTTLVQSFGDIARKAAKTDTRLTN